jgi:hypothetical protein
MEFIEGETLEKPIKRSGRLEVNLALEISAFAKKCQNVLLTTYAREPMPER